jgi:hypothetical protein
MRLQKLITRIRMLAGFEVLVPGFERSSGRFREHSAPQQKDHNDDYQYRAEAPTVIMVRSAQIETTAPEKENQNNQE